MGGKIGKCMEGKREEGCLFGLDSWFIGYRVKERREREREREEGGVSVWVTGFGGLVTTSMGRLLFLE